MISEHHVSERRACRLVGLSRDAYRHPPEPDALSRELSGKIVEIAHARRRLLENCEANLALIRRYIDVYKYPNGHIEIRADGESLRYERYDRLDQIDTSAIVENKGLGRALHVLN